MSIFILFLFYVYFYLILYLLLFLFYCDIYSYFIPSFIFIIFISFVF